MEDKLDDYKPDDDESEEKAPVAATTATSEAKTTFTEEELAKARKEVDEMLDQEDNVTGCTVAGPLTVKGVQAAEAPKKAPKRRAQGAVVSEVASTPATPASSSSSRPAKTVDNPWEADTNPWMVEAAAGDADSKASAGAPEEPSAKSSGKRKKKKAKTKASEPVEESQAEDGEAAEDVLGALSMDSAAAREQRELVRTAFVQGTQEEDFEAELEEEERAKEEKDKKAAVVDLPGWGSWAGEGAPKPRPSKASERAAAKAAARAAARQSATKSNSVQYEGIAESAKYFVDKVPYGIQTPEQYNQELRMPSGPEWNALPSHIQRIKPKFFSKVGAIVPPLQLVKHLPPEQRAGVIEKWAASKQPKRLKAKI